MLSSLIVYLRPAEAAPVAPALGQALHDLAFHLLGDMAPALARAAHESACAPFTISPLLGRFRRVGAGRWIDPAECYRVRYTFLQGALLDAIGQRLVEHHLEQEPLLLGGQPFQIERIALAPRDRSPWLRTITPAALARRPRHDPTITMRFASPTAFPDGSAFPQPTPLFASYQHCWQQHCGLPLPDDLLAFVAAHVLVAHHRLAARVVPWLPGQPLGFVGRCTYQIVPEDQPYVEALNLLADFALFAGTGSHTTQGMGQSRRLRPRRPDG